jgi:hypothetical protein
MSTHFDFKPSFSYYLKSFSFFDNNLAFFICASVITKGGAKRILLP